MSISVIIPLYNAEKYIAKALESCLQFDEVKEVLVIDDAYPDKGVDIVRDFIKKDNRVKLLQHPGNQNLGAGASRNLGIRNATQEYVAFLDADDFYLPNRFEKDKTVFDQYPDADGCYNALGAYFYSKEAKKIFLDHFGGEITTVLPEARPTPESLMHGILGLNGSYGYFHLDCLTIRRECLLKYQLFFHEGLRVHQDTDFIIRLSYYCRLYPSEISAPTAKRGVHNENRILETYQQDISKRRHKQYLLWRSLYGWAKKEKLNGKDVIELFRTNMEYNKMMRYESPQPFLFFKEIILNRHIFRNKQYREFHRFHTRPLGDRLSFGLLRLKNLLVK